MSAGPFNEAVKPGNQYRAAHDIAERHGNEVVNEKGIDGGGEFRYLTGSSQCRIARIGRGHQCRRNEKHIGDTVFHPESHESHGRNPERDDFARRVLGTVGGKDRQTHKPVTAMARTDFP